MLENISVFIEKYLETCIFDSTIIKTRREQLKFIKLCEFNNSLNWKLLYRASKDGFSSDAFHEKCDNRNSTVTIIKSTVGSIFGGFTECCWSENYVKENYSFLFSFCNIYKLPIKINCYKPDLAIYSHIECGPIFGNGEDDVLPDICISDMSNFESYTDLGNCYRHDLLQYGKPTTKRFLAGSFNFSTIDIEVSKLTI